MKTWAFAASAGLLVLTSGCKTVIDYGVNPPGGAKGTGHPWAAQWNKPEPPPAPVQAAPAPAPIPEPAAVAPVPVPAAAPAPAPAPRRTPPSQRVPRRERG